MNKNNVTFNMGKSMKQPKDFQVISMIDIIDDEVANDMEVNFISEPLPGVFWNYRSEEIKEIP